MYPMLNGHLQETTHSSAGEGKLGRLTEEGKKETSLPVGLSNFEKTPGR